MRVCVFQLSLWVRSAILQIEIRLARELAAALRDKESRSYVELGGSEDCGKPGSHSLP